MSKRVLPLVGVVVLCVTAVSARGQRPPIIDVHVHAIPATWSEGETPLNVRTGKPSTANTGKELLPRTLAELKRHNVKLAVLSGPLDTVRHWRRQAGSLFVGGPMFPVAYVESAEHLSSYMPEIEEIRTAFEEGQVGVIGEITAQYAGLAPGDSNLEPYFELAEKLDIPIGIHSGTGPPEASHVYPGHSVTLGNPILLDEVLVRHRKLRLYIMHAGYPFLQETLAILQMYPQVYADLSAINWRLPSAAFHRYLEALVIAGFGKRLMFGSDSEAWPEVLSLAIESIESADFLSIEQKADIFYNNAARFLRLDDEQIARHHGN